jgi:hypothetical protein
VNIDVVGVVVDVCVGDVVVAHVVGGGDVAGDGDCCVVDVVVVVAAVVIGGVAVGGCLRLRVDGDVVAHTHDSLNRELQRMYKLTIRWFVSWCTPDSSNRELNNSRLIE